MDLPCYRSSLNPQGHTDWVCCLALHPTDSKLVVTGSKDKTIRLWRRGDDPTVAFCEAILEARYALSWLLYFIRVRL